jgi:hypothetical protein
MTDPYTNATNVAGDRATVGLQAEVIHGDVYSYVVSPGASAKERYEVGVKYLNGGVPSAALPLIERAIAEGHDTSEVRFHWLLALISGRTFRQLSPEDTIRLDLFRAHPVVGRNDPWAEGVRVILRLLDSLRLPAADPGPFIAALEDLHPFQKESVLRHLAVFLRGPLGDQVWQIEYQAALDGRHALERDKRVGLFFLPPPARPRVRPTTPAVISARDRATASTAAIVFVIALIDVGWLLVQHTSIVGMLGYVLGCIGCCLAAAHWMDYRWRTRQRAVHAQRPASATRSGSPTGGFAGRVDSRFDHYFAVRVPYGTDPADWVDATAGVRRQLRDEIVSIYREQRVRAEQLDWLIRYEVQELARQWRKGTFHASADEFHVKPAATIARWAGVTGTLLGSLLVAGSLLRVDPACGLVAFVVLTVSGYRVERRWTGFALERRREATDEAANKRKLAERQAAYDEWLNKLADTKPSDQEMATWLEHDKKIILKIALRHYGLKRSDVISYAFLETPGTSYKRASVRNGPWRYTQYKILVFLLTEDGIRQAAFELRTRDGDIQPQDRRSYRYDAIASVETGVPRDDYQQTFDLHLVNGKTISFRATDPITQWISEETDAETLSNATQDATGLRNTLRILEGVAADGKEWVSRETQM